MSARPARQDAVRRHNRALLLGAIAVEPASRAALAARTGLARATVSSLVDHLQADGLVREQAAPRGTRGRPAAPLHLDPSGPCGVGVEIGVDDVAACVVDLTGRVRAHRATASDHRDRDPAVGLRTAAELVAAVVAEAGLAVAGIAAAVPGVVTADGVLQRAPNLPRWQDQPVAERLSAALGWPVAVGNEADLAALAERWAGGPPDFVLVSGGVGVGAGIVLGGSLFRGAGGRAGELGHVVVDPDGRACTCGGSGCLETVAGAAALLRVAGATDVDALLARPGPAVDVAARALGIALAGAVNLLDVPAVVLGGLYPRLGDDLPARVEHELARRVLGRPVTVRAAAAGERAALRGAATSAVRAVLAGGGQSSSGSEALRT